MSTKWQLRRWSLLTLLALGLGLPAGWSEAQDGRGRGGGSSNRGAGDRSAGAMSRPAPGGGGAARDVAPRTGRWRAKWRTPQHESAGPERLTTGPTDALGGQPPGDTPRASQSPGNGRFRRTDDTAEPGWSGCSGSGATESKRQTATLGRQSSQQPAESPAWPAAEHATDSR
jgi:hypothetical protein